MSLLCCSNSTLCIDLLNFKLLARLRAAGAPLLANFWVYFRELSMLPAVDANVEGAALEYLVKSESRALLLV